MPGSSGTTMVCCKDTVVPARDSMAITAQVGQLFRGIAGDQS